ncbi:MAG: DUF2752 domain-containing protein [Actinobacteria bacterium]|uniref:Unannotated protein n=1 Tax=freshwater metagenome TaxID=449393 RepID=A0A6J7QSE4_9ZZZZ|nr:DUF2752 domain-containing protein [Actinomycetota bacterium]
MPATIAYAPPQPNRGPSDLVARARTHLLMPTALAGGLALWDPARRGGPPLCPYRLVTGHNCPGCGLTRSAGAFLRGRWHEAFTLHALGPVLVVEALLVCLTFVVLGPRLRGRVPSWFGPAVLVANAVALFAVWTMRSSTGQISVLG